MEQELRQKLIDEAEALTKATGISEQSIGQFSIKDNTFFPRIRNGAGFTVKTYDRVMAFMETESAKVLEADTAA